MKYIDIQDLEEMNGILQQIKERSMNVFIKDYDNQYLGSDSYIEDKLKYICVYCRYNDKNQCFRFNKTADGTKPMSRESIRKICLDFGRVHKNEEVSEILGIYFDKTKDASGKYIGYKKTLGSASPIREANFKLYGRKATPHCYEYDIEHCYGQALKMPIPDLTTMRMNDVVKEGEVGFYRISGRKFDSLKATFTPGRFCEYIFKLKESPYKEYIEKLEDKLKNSDNEEEIDDVKNHFRIFVGEQQNHNPFLRAIIVERGTMVIRELEARSNCRTIYISTDSIVTEGPLENPNNNMFGFTFKCKHADQTFKLKDKSTLAYQWDLEMPKINGRDSLKVKFYNETHDKPFDILNDWSKIKDIEVRTKYIFDKNSLKLMEVYE